MAKVVTEKSSDSLRVVGAAALAGLPGVVCSNLYGDARPGINDVAHFPKKDAENEALRGFLVGSTTPPRRPAAPASGTIAG